MQQFEVKVKYPKDMDGTFKTVTESYLLSNCESFTEAETIANTIIFDGVKGETSVESIKRTKYQYILRNKKKEGWYKCQSSLTEVDEDTDRVTSVKNVYLVQADSVDDASKLLKDFIGDALEGLDVSGIIRVGISGVLEDRVVESNDLELAEVA